MTRFASETLARHERADFCSGHDRIDRYFGETVSQDVKRNYAACFVLIERSSGTIAGFYTLSAHSIPLNDVAPELAKRQPRYPSGPLYSLAGWAGTWPSEGQCSAACCLMTRSVASSRRQ